MHPRSATDNEALPERAPSHILVAIDDAGLCESACDHLGQHGYRTSTVASDEAACAVRQGGAADLLIVDAAGRGDEALRVCCAVRSISAIPIIVLSPRDDSEERIKGLDAGADDYLVKPFHIRQLVVRIKAFSRPVSLARRRAAEPTGYRFGDWRLDLLGHTLQHVSGAIQPLGATDFRLLQALVTHSQELLSRVQLCQIVRQASSNRLEQSIEVRISRLRRLLREERNLGARSVIRCVYGQGYVFDGAVVTDYSIDRAAME